MGGRNCRFLQVDGLDEPEDYDATEGCGCRLVPSSSRGEAWFLLLGLLLLRRRRA